MEDLQTLEADILSGLAQAEDPARLANKLCQYARQSVFSLDLRLVWRRRPGQLDLLAGSPPGVALDETIFKSPPAGCHVYQDQDHPLGALLIDPPQAPEPPPSTWIDRLSLLAHNILRTQQQRSHALHQEELLQLQMRFNNLLLNISHLFQNADSEASAMQDLCALLCEDERVELAWIFRREITAGMITLACAGDCQWLAARSMSAAEQQCCHELWQQPYPYLAPPRDRADTLPTAPLHLSVIIPIWRQGQLRALLALASRSSYEASDEPLIRRMITLLSEELSRNFARLYERLQSERTARIQQILLEHTGVGVTLVKNRSYVEVNRRFAQMLGYQHPDELKGRSTRHIYPNELEYHRVGAIYREARPLKHGQFIAQVQHQDGHLLTCQTSFGILYDDDDEELSVWTLIDISEMLERQRERDAYRAQLYKLTERVPGMLCQFRTRAGFEDQPEFSFLRGAVIKILHLKTHEDLRQLDAFEQIIPADRDALRQALAEHSRSLQVLQHEFRIHTRDGNEAWLHVAAMPEAEDETHTLWHGFISDTTEAHLLRDRLHESVTQIRAIFHASPTPISVSDLANMGFLRVNLAWQKLFGFSEAQVQGKTTQELGIWAADFDPTPLREQIRRSGHASMDGARMRNTQGHELICRLTATVIRSQQQNLIIVAVEDMTTFYQMDKELRRLNQKLASRVEERTQELEISIKNLQSVQNQLLQSERLSDLGARVASIAHDINTQIGNGRFAASSLLSALHQLDEKIDKGLKRSDFNEFIDQSRSIGDVIMRTMDSAAILVQQFNQMAVDRSSNRRRSFNLREHVEGILLMLKARIKHSHCQVSNEVPADIMLDSLPGPLEHSLTNLITNALHHAFDDPAQGHIRVAAEVDHDQVDISVRDDGRGLSPEMQARIFEPFFTTRAGQGGSGLGLAICQSAAQTLGGCMRLDSQPGQGSTFHLLIPLQAPPSGDEPS